MKLHWRGNDYNFNQMAFKTGKDKTKNGTVDCLITAMDTESCDTVYNGLPRYEPQTFQFSIPDDLKLSETEYLQYLPTGENALESFLMFVYNNFWPFFCEKKVFVYCHNLMYDWGQLIKNYPMLLSMARTGISPETDIEIFNNGTITATLKKHGLFVGNAPYFDIEIKPENYPAFILMFRDTFSFFPAALDSLGKELNLDEYKQEHPESLGKIDYRNMPECDEKIVFEHYAKTDAKVTRLVAERIRQLHLKAEMKRIRVSAPSYAISYLFHSLPEGIQILNGTNTQEIMQLIIDSYAGGRTGGIYHGYCENVSVLDIHSSYPCSMASLPSFNAKMIYYDVPNPEEITETELKEIFKQYHGFAKIDGREDNAEYPSLLYGDGKKLIPVYGEFTDISSTGPEIYLGIVTGNLHVTRVKQLVILLDNEPEYYPFRVFAHDAYTRKQDSEKGTPEYISAKLVLNASYGKLIESRRSTFIDAVNNDVILPYVEELKTKFAQEYYIKYLEMIKEGKDDFIAYLGDDIKNIIEAFPKDIIRFGNLGFLSLIALEYGRNAIPAAAALITGISRARLLCAIKLLGAIYWDTDSVFITQKFDKNKINKALEKSKDLLPDYVQPLKIGENLGDLDAEMINGKGYLAGVKRYFLTDGEEIKRALHGMPTVDKKNAEELIRNLSQGKNAEYIGKAKPMKFKESKNSNELGKFTQKKYESVFELDTRLEWVPTPSGWRGKIREFGLI